MTPRALALPLLAVPFIVFVFGCGSDNKGNGPTPDAGADSAVADGGSTPIGGGPDAQAEDGSSAAEAGPLRDAGGIDAPSAPDTAETAPATDGASAQVDSQASDIAASRDVATVDLAYDAQPDSGLGIGGADAAAINVMSCVAVVQGLSTCVEFAGPLTGAQASQEQSGCVQGNASTSTAPGTFALAACPTGGSGACVNIAAAGAPAGVSLKYVYYGLTSKQLADAQKVCTSILGGSWTSG